MKLVGLTMRQSISKARNEYIDTIDVKWLEFITSCGFIPLLIPNNTSCAKQLLSHTPPQGIILTGGNDPFIISGKITERDKVESYLLDWAERKNHPVVGICRGMEVLLGRMGSKFVSVENHVNVRHSINIMGTIREVNSFHNYRPLDATHEFEIIATSANNVIEGVRGHHLNQLGIMWHPEREKIFSTEDKILITQFMENN